MAKRDDSVLVRLAASLVVWGLYGLALWLPVLDVPRTGGWYDVHGLMPGWSALIFGWWPPLCVPWAANWVFLFAWIAFISRRPDAAFRRGIFAAILGATTLVIMMGELSELRIGFVLWEASFLVLAGLARRPASRVEDRSQMHVVERPR